MEPLDSSRNTTFNWNPFSVVIPNGEFFNLIGICVFSFGRNSKRVNKQYMTAFSSIKANLEPAKKKQIEYVK